MHNIKSKIRSLSFDNPSVKSLYSFANKAKTRLLRGLNDETFAKLKYYENTGRKLNLRNPTKFNEKLWWLKLNNRDPLLTRCSDKITVREYVNELGLSEILNEIYGIYENANDIDFNDLPDYAFIKTNHGSGTNIVWRGDNEAIIRIRKKMNSALKENYYWQSREWNYKNIQPKLLIEKNLCSGNSTDLLDYRYFCFDGRVKIVAVDIETAAQDGTHNPYAKRNIYDREFNFLNVTIGREKYSPAKVFKPHRWDEMLQYAERLSQPFPFCRVDLYNINGEIYFGEMTFYPGGATQIVEPNEWEIKMGNWINLNSDKILM